MVLKPFSCTSAMPLRKTAFSSVRTRTHTCMHKTHSTTSFPAARGGLTQPGLDRATASDTQRDEEETKTEELNETVGRHSCRSGPVCCTTCRLKSFTQKGDLCHFRVFLWYYSVCCAAVDAIIFKYNVTVVVFKLKGSLRIKLRC